MARHTFLVAVLAAVAIGSAGQAARALDNQSYALYSAGKSSDDSWNKCNDDHRDFGKSYGDDDRHRHCYSKKWGNNGWGNGGDDGNPGSDRGNTAPTKTDFSVR